MDAKILGQRLRERREYLRLSQKAVAELLGISEKGYGHYERGRSEPAPSTLSRLADILQVPIGYFYDDEDIVGPTDSSYYDGLSPARKAAADEIIRALWMEDQRAETTHGPKAR